MRELKEIYTILREIIDSGGLTDDMSKNVESLKDEFDEREGMLTKKGDPVEGKDPETEAEPSGEVEPEGASEEPETKEEKDWESEYNKMRKAYYDRFFNGQNETDGQKTNKEEVITGQNDQVKEDNKNLASSSDGETIEEFDDLFEKREGK